MRNSAAKCIALGGMTAALAVVIMCLGGLIPVATYVCPMLCTLLLSFVLHLCGTRISWAWYGAVTILSLLLGPDKEASAIFLCLGYYPILKPKLDKLRLAVLWKLILFNTVIGVMYWILVRLFGMEQLAAEFQELGMILLIILLILGNLTFILLDVVLKRLARKF
ncbi:MAG: hypothetical protein IJX67_11690 [Oscillospiraceae bacterium]|nr:hypothetical protein [Oscillospiraceae bacterium]